MAVKSKTSERLWRLAEMDKKDLGRKSVAELFDISRDAVYSRFKKRGFDFHLRRDVARVIREYRPLIDKWYNVERAAQETGIDEEVLTYWSRDKRARREMGVKNAGMHLYVHPSWVKKTARKVQRAGGRRNLIQARKAATILSVDLWKLERLGLHTIQFTGRKSRCYYPQDKVLRLRERVERLGGWENLVLKGEVMRILGVTRNKADWLGLHRIQFHHNRGAHYFRLDDVLEFKKRVDEADSLKTTRVVAAELDLTDKQVLRHIRPTMHHPLSREPRYHSDVIEKNRNMFCAGATTLKEILDYCNKNIQGDEELRKRVKHLVYLRHIPVLGKDGAQSIYLSRDSEDIIKEIYQNHKLMAVNKISLLTIMEASSQMTISEKQLRHLVDFYGASEALSSKKFPSTSLHLSREGKLVVPYVVYTPGSRSYFLNSEVARQLDIRIRFLQRKLAREGRELRDTPWRMRLANVYDSGASR